MTDTVFHGVRFDGRTALAQDVEVRLLGRTLHVLGRDGVPLERARIDPAKVSERFAAAPRIVALGHGVTLEIADPQGAFDRALQGAGVVPTPVQRLQHYWPTTLVALAGLVGVLAFAYLNGVPAAAHWLAFHLPKGLEQDIGGQVLTQLDGGFFKPSELSAERRDAFREKFEAAAALAAPDVAYKLEFRRKDGQRGVNAMALPGGTIVLLDGLVQLADNDDALIGVAAHELGHIAHKHSVRQLLQSLGIGALAAVLWGDFSNAIANVPLAFGVLRYSRDFEREADDYAIEVLKANRISTLPLLEFFGTMEKKSRKDGRPNIPAWLSSHPTTAERQQRLREAE